MVSCDSLLAIQSSKQCSNSVLSCSRSSADEWESLWRGENMSEGVRVDGVEGRVMVWRGGWTVRRGGWR